MFRVILLTFKIFSEPYKIIVLSQICLTNAPFYILGNFSLRKIAAKGVGFLKMAPISENRLDPRLPLDPVYILFLGLYEAVFGALGELKLSAT